MPMKLANVRKKTAKNSAGPNCSAKRGDQRREERDQDDGDERADERRRERGRQRFVRAALLRHRMAIERRRDRPRFTGNIEEDRCDRTTEQRPPVDAGQHDDGRRRRHREGQRQQDRDAIGAAQSGQHADNHAEQDADEHQCQVVRGQRDAEPCINEEISSKTVPPCPPSALLPERERDDGSHRRLRVRPARRCGLIV